MSAKNIDLQGRFRCRNVSFRVSPEEAELLDILVKLSGLTKQDYIIDRLLCRDIIVYGNPRVYKALKGQLEAVLGELLRIRTSENVTHEMLETIKYITAIMNGMKEESDG